MVVKPEFYESATAVFAGTGVQITTQGRRHLGAALGSRSFVESFVSERVDNWTTELKKLAKIATCHPLAAYSGFVHGVRERWLYLARVIPDIADLFQPLEEGVYHVFLPALTGHPEPGEVERELLSLPL